MKNNMITKGLLTAAVFGLVSGAVISQANANKAKPAAKAEKCEKGEDGKCSKCGDKASCHGKAEKAEGKEVKMEDKKAGEAHGGEHK